jgi:cytochrome P450
MSIVKSTQAGVLPPGPRIPGPLQTLLFMTAQERMAPYWHRKYGDVFSVRLAMNRAGVVLTRPEHIREVFSGAPSVFRGGDGNAALAAIFGEHSVVVLDGEGHKLARKRLVPAFNGAALRGYAEMMDELAERVVERWPVGRPFAVHPSMNTVTLEIILRVVFGLGEGTRLAELRRLLPKVVDFGPVELLGLTYPTLRRYWPWKLIAENSAAADRLIYDEIADRRLAGDLTDRTDVLSRLLSAPDSADVSDQELRDDMITLLLAGHETSSTGLAWTFYELSRRPAVLRRTEQAVDEGDTEYLTAVVKEVLRLRPVLYLVARRLSEPTEVAGYQLPAGTVVAPSVTLAQQDPEQFAVPEEFQPERFLGKQPSTSAYIPFGGGVRRCIGAEFSLRETVAVLRAALQRYRIMPGGGRPERPKSRNFLLAPSRGGRIVVYRR